MKYDYDSYMFYEYSKNFAFTVRIRVRLKDRIDGEILEDAAKKAFKRFPYFNITIRKKQLNGISIASAKR